MRFSKYGLKKQPCPSCNVPKPDQTLTTASLAYNAQKPYWSKSKDALLENYVSKSESCLLEYYLSKSPKVVGIYYT